MQQVLLTVGDPCIDGVISRAEFFKVLYTVVESFNPNGTQGSQMRTEAEQRPPNQVPILGDSITHILRWNQVYIGHVAGHIPLHQVVVVIVPAGRVLRIVILVKVFDTDTKRTVSIRGIVVWYVELRITHGRVGVGPRQCSRVTTTASTSIQPRRLARP